MNNTPTKTRLLLASESTEYTSNLNRKNVTSTSFVKSVRIQREEHQPKLRLVTDPLAMPTETKISTYTPPQRLPTKHVDSRSEMKQSDDYSPKMTNSYQTPVSPTSAIPKYVGSTFFHLPSTQTRPPNSMPIHPTIPRPYPPIATKDYSSSPTLLHNRSPSGSILGAAGKRFVDEKHIPYLPPDIPVGPENPMKVLSDIWTACWDDEAGAIYYYNTASGEATWVPPEI